MEGIFVLFLLFLLVLFLLLVAVMPSILNLIISFYAYFIFKKIIKERITAIIIGVVISMALTFNLRAKELLYDILTSENSNSAMGRVSIQKNESLFVDSSIESIFYRESIFSTLSIEASSNCGCVFQKNPKVIEEKIYASISKLGIATSSAEKSSYQLHLSSVREGGVEKISLVLSKGGKALNTRTISTRQIYSGEEYLLEKNEFSASAIINYVFGYTFWVPIFESLFDRSPKDAIFYNALESMLVVENEQLTSKEAVATLVSTPAIDHLSLLEPARSGKKIGCDSENISLEPIDWSRHVLEVRGNRMPVNVGNTFESIVCDNSAIYVISTPSNYEDFFEVYEFSRDGVPVARAKYRIDPVAWKGFPRKPLVFFQVNGDSLLLGVLDTNEEKTIHELYFYNIKIPSKI